MESTKSIKNTESKDSFSRYNSGIMYGVMNGLMVIPIGVSFCAIIFNNTHFQIYMPKLVKLVLFSSVVHQLCFSKFSSLPFAIGQVQDAGLIFLSAMAGSIVDKCSNYSRSPNSSIPVCTEENILPTTLVVLAIATCLLGCMLIVVSKLRLASIIQYIPMPVIGGYLAFIGFYCGQAGLAMMAGVVGVSTIADWGLFFTFKSFILLLPGVIIGSVMYVLVRTLRSPYVLPCCMAVVLLSFYTILMISGISFQQARDAGWIAPLSPVEPFYESWTLYGWRGESGDSLIVWSLIPEQFGMWVGMFLVVAFSSSLDVAAIEMELGLPLDYNKELYTVGLSNVFSGLLGGYTGSYIFSQTIFTMRRGVSTRICGYTVAVCELAVILLPISITSYVPKMFFGSLLVLISIDLLIEWLIDARDKMMNFEYAVCVSTFIAIQISGIEIGMLIGVLLATFSFVVTYARLQTVSAASLKSSTVIRTFEERAVLIANRGKVMTISLRGYIFFGSAVQILEDVKSRLLITTPESQMEPSLDVTEEGGQANSNTDEDEDIETAASYSKSLVSALRKSKADPEYSDPLLKRPRSKDESTGYSSKKNKPAVISFPTKVVVTQAGDAPSSTLELKMVPIPSAPTPAHTNSNVIGLPKSSSNERMFSLTSSPIAQSSSLTHAHLQSVYDLSEMDIVRHNEKWVNKTATTTTSNTNNNGTSIRLSPHSILAASATTFQPTSPKPVHLTGPSMLSLSLSAAKKAEETKKKDVTILENTQDARKSAFPPMKGNSDEPIHTQNDKKVERKESWFLEDPPNVLPPSNSSLNTNDSLYKNPLINDSSSLLAVVWESQVQRRDKDKEMLQSLLSRQDMGSTVSSYGSVSCNHSPTVSSSNISSSQRAKSRSFSAADPSFKDINSFPPRNSNDISSSNSNSNSANAPTNKPKGLASSAQLHSIINTQNSKSSYPNMSLGLPALRRDSSGLSNTSDGTGKIASLSNSPKVLLSKIREPGSDDDSLPQQILTEFLVLDFTSVLGVDATAARSCFLMLIQLMKIANVVVVFANMSPTIERLLRAHNVIQNRVDHVVIPQLDDALEWCEEQVLYSMSKLDPSRSRSHTKKGLQRDPKYYSTALKMRQSQLETASPLSLRPSQSMSDDGGGDNSGSYGDSLRRILEDYLEIDPHSNSAISQLLSPSLLGRYFKRVIYASRDLIFDIDQAADEVYFIEQGVVEIVTISPHHLTEARSSLEQSVFIDADSEYRDRSESNISISKVPIDLHLSIVGQEPPVKRVNKVSSGGAFGEADFFLGRNHCVRAYVLTESCACWVLGRQSYANMEVSHPRLCMLLQHTLLKSLAISATCSMYALHPSTAYSASDAV